jgi:nucleoid DNA-binding protein
MIKEKISSQEIIDQVAGRASVSKRAAEDFLKVMISTIEDALMAGDAVKIKGFGTFKLQWNEPRKSVNVSTGEEIIIEGYYKVAFAPEASLKELVNEPFSHLEPVQLDGGDNFVLSDVHDEVALDPLRIFTEQATEIKDLLSEIQALSPVKSKESKAGQFVSEVEIGSVGDESLLISNDLAVVEEVVDTVGESVVEDLVDVEEFDEKKNEGLSAIFEQEVFSTLEYLPIEPDEFIVDSDKESELVVSPVVEELPLLEAVERSVLDQSAVSQSEVESVSDYFAQEKSMYSGVETVEEKDKVVESNNLGVTAEPELEQLETSPFLLGVKSSGKSKKWWWISAVFVLLIGIASLFVFYPPANDFGNRVWSSSKAEVSYLKEKISIGGMLDAVSNWFQPKQKEMIKVPETVVIPKDTSAVDTVVLAKEPIDTLQQLFDQKRDYEVYIASEQIKEGSRLTIMSEKYYGSKDFWVYIYEANIDRIKNPDHIEMGTLIRVPKLDPRLIDATNPRCVEKARELHDKYVKKKS